MAENVVLLKDTVNIHCFYKNWYETAREHLSAFKTAPFIF